MSQMTSLAAIATPTSAVQMAAATVARRGRARAQSRPKSTLEGGQSLFRAWPAFGVPGDDILGAVKRRRGAPKLLLSSVADRRLYSSRGSFLGLYGQDDARAAGSKVTESLWARSA